MMNDVQLVARITRRTCLLACAILLPCASAASAQGQAPEPAVVAGTVTDSATGAGIVGAEVSVEGTAFRAVTDENGAFHLVGAAASGSLKIRRLGYRAESVALRDANELRVRLAPVARHLSSVVVRAERKHYSGRLADYYQRLERRVGGTFITRQDIEREKPRQLTDLLRQTAGLSVARAQGSAARQVLHMRGRECQPIVWIDGAAMSAGEVDLNSFSPTSLEGVEMYFGATSAPPRYTAMNGQAECGTILLWSRGTDTEPRHQQRRMSPSELEAMIASATIYTADQVDSGAVPDSAITLPIVPYPAALKATSTGGMVIAEFVVDTTGHVEAETFGVVSATHPLFVDAVREAVEHTTYRPAMRAGKAVRQLVRQPFEFVPPVRGRG